mmetsp:Transcript_25072/g.50948  ORF Transcript_25072/g.50948 Transcript_25072/m.50948 type:complete len:173 (+) Transcript_25072:110-628(+)|eukprot:CAMPEP_0181314824 /NCGR_PEP_ID=MMETSP1101-20121128/15029_1 /TAXON_ID=46948 /ORGANISM="Rhodomonas abbreviata, Strain Caron Lab Isolate" /LENGTH=172 /DNA_ID=CAMNT_0023421953 /DNA_START=103 /DNA_END=621 /DNA_ORIENTATION=-
MCSVDEAVALVVPDFGDDFLQEFLSDTEWMDNMPTLGPPSVELPVTKQVNSELTNRISHPSRTTQENNNRTCPEESLTTEERSPSPPVTGPKKAVVWSKEEEAIFLCGISTHCPEETRLRCIGLGPGVAQLISDMIVTRSAAQVRSHAQKYFQRLRRLQKADTATQSCFKRT